MLHKILEIMLVDNLFNRKHTYQVTKTMKIKFNMLFTLYTIILDIIYLFIYNILIVNR